ncbi:hypothetical protein UE98_29875 [Burkholderia cenocepacia]|nr:hypothetical protein UE98_29875 [Burkholderia cenocepacia]
MSAITRLMLNGPSTLGRLAAAIVLANISSMPASLRRLHQCVSDWQLVLQVRLAREHLAVWVLNRLPDHFLVGHAKGLLQIHQAGDRAR